MAVIFSNPADYEAAKIVADALGDKIYQVTQETVEQFWNYIRANPGVYILVGGENANPLTNKLLSLGLIEPLADPNKKYKAVIQYVKLDGSEIYVVAGWEKEETLWTAKVIAINKGLPDMEKYQQITGKKIMIFDVGYIPKIYQVEFTFVTIPYVNLSEWVRTTLKWYLESKGYKVYFAKIDSYTGGPLGMSTHYVLTIEAGEPVVQQAAIPALILGIIILLATIGAVIIAWRVVDVWTKKEEINLARIVLQSEVEYQQEKLSLLKSIQQLPQNLQQEALKIIETRPSVLYQTLQQPTTLAQIRDIIVWTGILIVVGIAAYTISRAVISPQIQRVTT